MRVWPLTVFLLISNTMPVSHKTAWLGYQRHLSPTGVSPPFSLVRLVLPASYDAIYKYINPRTIGIMFTKYQQIVHKINEKQMDQVRDTVICRSSVFEFVKIALLLIAAGTQNTAKKSWRENSPSPVLRTCSRLAVHWTARHCKLLTCPKFRSIPSLIPVLFI